MNIGRIKFGLGVLAGALTLAAGAADVKPSKIKPAWSGAKTATWTMDYEAALLKAAATGKCTIMMYSGMWWCPHCQHLEENVLTQAAWKKFAQANGFFETVLDFPNRAGNGYWCWLWDNSFRKTARLTAEEATEEIIRRYDVQNSYSIPGSQHQVAVNEVIEVVGKGKNMVTNRATYAAQPQSEYNRVGYPTMIVLAPDGTELGRFSPSKNNAEYVADPINWVKAKVNSILYPGAGEVIAEAGQYEGFVLTDEKTMAGTVMVKTGKPNKDTNLAAISLTFAFADGKKLTAKTTVFSAENVSAAFVDNSGNEIEFTLGASVVSGRVNGQVFTTARNLFAEKDAAALLALEAVKGNWTLALNGTFATSHGCQSCGSYVEGMSSHALLTLTIGSVGKVKVTGTTADGMKISTTAQLSLQDGLFVLPLMDAKKTGLGFVLFFDAEGEKVALGGARAGEKLQAFAQPSDELPETMYYDGDDGIQLKLSVKANKLTASKLGFSLKYTPRSGAVKGSYRTDDGKTVSVEGLFAGTEGYLFAKPKGGNVFPARISSVKPKDFDEKSGDDDCDDCHD